MIRRQWLTGASLGTLEPRLVLSRLLWKYDIECCQGNDPDWLDQRVYVTWTRKPLHVRLRRRD